MFKYKLLEKSPFQFWEVKLVLPKVKWGKVSFTEDYDNSLEDGQKYSVSFPSEVGYYEDNHFNSVWIIIFGFGANLSKQDGY